MRNLVLTVVGLLLCCGSPAFAWHTNTHLQMVRDSLALMPKELQSTFQEHLKYVERGIRDPDELIRDWQNHYYIPADPPQGGAIDRIDKISKIIQMKIQTGNSAEISKQLCYVAHYIADVWSPESLLKTSATASDQEFIKNHHIVVLYEGHQQPIENIREYMEKRSRWRWTLENSSSVSTLLYSEAINDIARVWLTLWQQSGKKVEPQTAQVMIHKKGALNVNFERLLLEEYYYRTSAKGPGQSIDRLENYRREMKRLSENVRPSDTAMYAKTQLRNQQSMMSKLAPEAPFSMLETSVKTVGDKAYLVARIFNKSEEEIPSIAFMYPGVRGPVALIRSLPAGGAAKIQAELPADSKKEQIELIFASPEEK